MIVVMLRPGSNVATVTEIAALRREGTLIQASFRVSSGGPGGNSIRPATRRWGRPA